MAFSLRVPIPSSVKDKCAGEMNTLVSKMLHNVDSMDRVRKQTLMEKIKGSRSKEGICVRERECACVCLSVSVCLSKERLYTLYMGLTRVPCSFSSPQLPAWSLFLNRRKN